VKIELDEAGRERLLQAALGLTLGEAENVFAKIIVKEQRLSGDDVSRSFCREAANHPQERPAGVLRHRGKFLERRRIGRPEGLAGQARGRLHRGSAGLRPAGAQGHFHAGRAGLRQKFVRQGGVNPVATAAAAFRHGPDVRQPRRSSEENVRRAIAVAESVAPAILWVDEIDKAFAGSQGSGATDGGTTARVFGTFLTWLSEKTAPVFVVATANDISQLPPELLRKGRLDEIFFVDLPGEEEREEIFRIHIWQTRPGPGPLRHRRAVRPARIAAARKSRKPSTARSTTPFMRRRKSPPNIGAGALRKPCRWPRRWTNRSTACAIGRKAAPATPACRARRKKPARCGGWNCEPDFPR
jgi:hypothetical protein